MKKNTLFIIILLLNLMVTSLLSGCALYVDKYIFDTNNTSEKEISTIYSSSTQNNEPTPPASSNNQITSSNSASLTEPITHEGYSKTFSGQASSRTVNISSEADLYDSVVSTVSEGKDLVVNLNGNIKKDGISHRVIKILEDTGYSSYISGVEYSENNSTILLKYNYKGGKDNFLSKIQAVNAKVQEIVTKLIKPNMSDFEKELAVHDYLVNNIIYDYDNLINNTVPDDSFTAYGALLKGIAVCSGYSEAMYKILNSIGVETLIVTGSSDNTPHAWNIVKVDGDYYHVDVTFDDPISSSGNLLTYNYFNITDSKISKDHEWIYENYPNCTSVRAPIKTK